MLQEVHTTSCALGRPAMVEFLVTPSVGVYADTLNYVCCYDMGTSFDIHIHTFNILSSILNV